MNKEQDTLSAKIEIVCNQLYYSGIFDLTNRKKVCNQIKMGCLEK